MIRQIRKQLKLLFYIPECLENNIIRICHDDINQSNNQSESNKKSSKT